jgi:hypothetical protein
MLSITNASPVAKTSQEIEQQRQPVSEGVQPPIEA